MRRPLFVFRFFKAIAARKGWMLQGSGPAFALVLGLGSLSVNVNRRIQHGELLHSFILSILRCGFFDLSEMFSRSVVLFKELP